jgi:hypothetical protein
LDGSDLDLIEARGDLFAVARDERQRRTFVEQVQRPLDLDPAQPELIGQDLRAIELDVPRRRRCARSR